MPGEVFDTVSDLALSTVRRMALREAELLLRHPPFGAWVADPPPVVRVLSLPCPWCGKEEQRRAGLVPMAGVRLSGGGERPDAALPTLTALSCERLTARPLLLWAQVEGREGEPVPPGVLTRAAALAQLLGVDEGSRVDEGDRWESALPELDARESWLDGSVATAVGAGGPVLPASFRPHLITPHLADGRARRLNDEYLRSRLSAVAAGLGRPAAAPVG